MNNLDLLNQTKKYLDDYLEEYVYNKKENDFSYFYNGIDIKGLNLKIYNLNDIEKIDFHKINFENINNYFTKKPLQNKIEKIINMKNPVVLDVASFCGEHFGLFIAKYNKSAKVNVYNPAKLDMIPKFVFNNKNPKICKLKKETLFQKNYQNTINNLYKENNLDNINFHNKEITTDIIIDYAKQNKNIILYSSRVFQLLPMFDEAISKQKNIDYIIMPLSNIPKNETINGFFDDKTIQKIAKYHRTIRDYKFTGKLDCSNNTKTRLISAMNIYLTLKMSLLKNNSKVYQLENETPGFPFSGPTHYVSSL